MEDGRWKIEFTPISVGVYKIHHLVKKIDSNNAQMEPRILYKVNVLNYTAQRVVYGYKLYSIQESVQLVFDAANFAVQEIWPEVKDPDDELVDEIDCKYLSDYLALKFTPEYLGNYFVNFYDRTTIKHLGNSPYKITVHDNYRELIKSCGIYDLTRLNILHNILPNNLSPKMISIAIFGKFCCCLF